MFFLLSKLLVPLETPSDLLLLLLCLGTVCCWFARSRRTGIAIVSGVAAILLFILVTPVSSWVAAPLENRFPPQRVLPEKVDGIIVLGGAIKLTVSAKRGIPSLNSDAERMIEFVRLAKAYPNARLLFSGGSGLPGQRPSDMTEAQVARLFFRQQGLDTARMVFEDRSRNTYENVLFSKALVKPVPGQTWLLVTSAQDVPRSIGIFRKLNWPVVPVPVAYKAGETYSPELGGNLFELDHGMHEWLGLLVYRLTGKTNALFPAPD